MNEYCKMHNDRTDRLETKIDKISEVVVRLEERLKILTEQKQPVKSSFFKTKSAVVLIESVRMIVLLVLTSIFIPQCAVQETQHPSSDIQLSIPQKTK